MAFVWSTNEISKKTVTIYSTNLTLNTAACKHFENVQYVLLGVDKENNLLGIKPVDREYHLDLSDKQGLKYPANFDVVHQILTVNL
mgnify:CR=1 FL=1